MVATDATGNTASQPFTALIDRTAPQQTLTGQLASPGTAPLTAPTYSLQVMSDDSSGGLGDGQVSGVRDITVSVDGKQDDVFPGVCFQGDCSTGSGTFMAKENANYVFQNGLFPAGSHAITVVTRDNAGHSTSKTVSFTTAPTTPSSVGGSSDMLGLEQFYPYKTIPTGAGSTANVNLASGNLVWDLTPINNPGTGLSSFVKIDYNSQRRLSDLGLLGLGYNQIGAGWSIAISGLTRLNEPLSVSMSGGLTFVDGDGTQHTFPKDPTPGSNSYLTPPGVHLHFRMFGNGDPTKTWAATRPDGVTYFFNAQGFQTSVVDRNGNALTYTYESIGLAGGPCIPVLGLLCSTVVQKVTDAGGRSLNISYQSSLLNALGAPQISDIADHDGHDLHFCYAASGAGDPECPALPVDLVALLAKAGPLLSGEPTAIVEAHTPPGMPQLPERRTFQFDYTTLPASGLTALLLPQLASVTDPNANKTTFGYSPGVGLTGGSASSCPASVASGGVLLPSCVSTVGDRDANAADKTGLPAATPAYMFHYGSGVASGTCAGLAADVTDPRMNDWCYQIDGQGRPTRLISPEHPHSGLLADAAGTETDLAWDGDNNVIRLTDAFGTPSQTVTTSSYDQNGRLLTQTDPNHHVTSLTYQYSTGVAALTASGDVSGFVGDLKALQTPNGVNAGTSYVFALDPSNNGNVLSATDPEGQTSTTHYNANGTIAYEVDANGNQTSFPTYDASGFPTEKDAPAQTSGGAVLAWRYSYDANGNLLDVEDPRGTAPLPDGTSLASHPFNTALSYDNLNRIVAAVAAKDSQNGEYVTTKPVYDHNDNQTSVETSDPVQGPLAPADTLWTATFTPMDKLLSQSSPAVPHQAPIPLGPEVTTHSYDAADSLISTTSPAGQGAAAGSFATQYVVDEAGKPIVAIRDTTTVGQQNLVSSTCYDRRGNVTGTADANTNLAQGGVAAAAANACDPTLASTRYGFDGANNRIAMIVNPAPAITRKAGKTPSLLEGTSYSFDANDNLLSVIDPRGTSVNAAGVILLNSKSNNFKTAYGYDQRDLLVSVTDPLKGLTIFTRRGDTVSDLGDGKAGDGRIVGATQPNANATIGGAYTTTYTYDPENWLSSYSLPQAPSEYQAGIGTVKYTRDQVGNPTTITDARKNALTNAFYDTGELKSTSRPSWWTYDPSQAGAGAGGPDPNGSANNQVAQATPGAGMALRERSPVEQAAFAAQRAAAPLPSATNSVQTGTVDPQVPAPLLPLAGSTSFTYDMAMNLTGVTGQPNAPGQPAVFTSLQRDAVGRVIDAVGPFDGAAIAGVVNTIDEKFGYDLNGNLVSSALDVGGPQLQAPTTYAYDQFDRRTSQTAPPPVVAPNVGPITAPLEITRYGYDANGNQTSLMTPVQSAAGATGVASTSTFDGLNETLTATDANGNETFFGYDVAGNQTSVTRPNGLAVGANSAAFTTVNAFDADNRLTSSVAGVTGALQATAYGYDKNGNQTSSQQLANLSGVACPAVDGCLQTTTTFDGRGLPWATTTGSTSTDRRTTITEYDQAGDLRRTVENAGVDPSTRLPYQADDGTSDPPSAGAQLAATVRTYDPSGFMTQQYLPWGCPLAANAGHTACDPTSPAATMQPRYRQTYTADALGRTKTIHAPYAWLTGADGATNTYSYFPDGWVSSDAQATTTGATTVPGRVDSYQYDQRGNEVSWTATPPATSTTGGFTNSRTYFANGLLEQLCGKQAGITSCQRGPYNFDYTLDNKLKDFQDPKPLAGTVTPAVTAKTALVYDAGDRLLTTAVTRLTDPSNQQPIGGAGDTQYTYDADGNVTTRQTDGTIMAGTYTGGKTTQIAYDALDRESRMTVTPPTATLSNPVRVFATTYTAAGLTSSRTITQNTSGATPTVENYSYTDDARLAQLNRNTNPVENTAYSFDVNGNTTTDEQGTHQYNAQDQETKWTRGPGQPNPGTSVTYLPNGSGAVLQKSDTATNASTTYALTGDQITAATTTTGAAITKQAYCYDGLGDLTKMTGPPAGSTNGTTPTCTGQVDNPTATSTNTYTAFGQLSTTINPDPKSIGHTVRDSYTYDALDRRDTKVDTPFGSAPADYLSSYIGLTPALTRETAPPAGGGTIADVRTYDYNSALRPIGFTDQTNGTPATYMSYALQANGSTQALIDATNTIKPQNTYYYDPYGNQQNTLSGANSLTGPALTNPDRYQGFYLDATGQTYNTPAREYQPSSSTFLTPDRYESASGDLNLISDPLTNNRYAYAGGNPTSNIDYGGHSVKVACSTYADGSTDCAGRGPHRDCITSYFCINSNGTLSHVGAAGTPNLSPGETPVNPLANFKGHVASAAVRYVDQRVCGYGDLCSPNTAQADARALDTALLAGTPLADVKLKLDGQPDTLLGELANPVGLAAGSLGGLVGHALADVVGGIVRATLDGVVGSVAGPELAGVAGVVSTSEAQDLLVASGFSVARAASFVRSFEGPVSVREVQAGEQFVRYTGSPNSKGSFLTTMDFGTPGQAVRGLALGGYDNPATYVQTVTAVRPSLVLEGGIAGGGPGATQTVAVEREAFEYGAGRPYP